MKNYRGFDNRPVSASNAVPFSYSSNTAPNTLEITIERVGACEEEVPFELFNPSFGISQLPNGTFFPSVEPITLSEGLLDYVADPVNGSYAYFNASGDLVVGRFNAVTPANECAVKISCKEVPYKALLEHLRTTVLKVVKNRMSFTDASTLSQAHYLGRATLFGAKGENTYNPTAYFDPNQQQSKVVDILEEYDVSGNFFLRGKLAPAETRVSMFLSISAVSENGVRTI